MMRLPSYLVMLTVMCLFISLMGVSIPVLNPINQNVGISITNSSVDSVDIENGGIYNTLFSSSPVTVAGISFSTGILLALAGTAVIVIGLFARGYDVSIAILPFIVFVGGMYIATFTGVMLHVVQYGQAWATGLVIIIFGGIAIGFIVSLVSYFAGR